jgi:hypothetical protein
MPGSEPETFYKYKGEDGVEYIVNSLNLVPDKAKASVQKIDLAKQIRSEIKQAEEKVGEGFREAKHVQKEVSGVVPFVADLDLPSMAVGFGVALFVFLLLTFIWRTGKMLLKIGLVVGMLVFFGGAYFGWVRRAAGLGSEAITSPTRLIHDAKDSADKVKAQIKAEERMLKKVEDSSR